MARRRRLVALSVALLVGLMVAGIWGVRAAVQGPFTPAGVRDGRLAPCPDKPNCVSTQAADEEHRMDPLPLEVTVEEALRRLENVVKAFPRARVVRRDGHYLHAEFTSWLFGFVDDVEFLVEEDAGQIQFRSASRVGYSDLGVNRRRMNAIRERYLALSSSPSSAAD